MGVLDMALVVAAGFAAGALNAVAGGGTFLALPALLHLGVPPVVANATTTIAALPGYGASAWALRGSLRAEGSLSLRAILLASGGGCLVGAGLLLVTPDAFFSGLVPWLLLLATGLFAVGPVLMARLRRGGAGTVGPVVSGAVIAVVSVYGGYFNGGLGILLLAAFGLIGFSDMQAMNALKCALSALLSVVAAGAFVLGGVIAWDYAAPMAAGTALGGFAGGWASRRITRTAYLRAFVIIVGLVMAALFAHG